MCRRLAPLLLAVALLASGCQRTPEPKPVTVNIGVDGMVCESCVEGIEGTLANMEGIEKIEVDLETTLAVIEFDETKISREEVEAAIERLGYTVTPPPETAKPDPAPNTPNS